MSTLTATKPTTRRPVSRPDVAGGHWLLHDVTWEQYVKLIGLFPERPLRHAYSDGVFEVMVLSLEHDRPKSLLHILLVVLAAHFKQRIIGIGSTTLQKRVALKGLEPDQCYYLRGLEFLKGKKRLNLDKDPSPNLAFEVDVTHAAVSRMAIYPKLGVEEVWVLRGLDLQFKRLQKDGNYRVAERSGFFPKIRAVEQARFLKQGEATDDTNVLRSFQDWLRAEFGADGTA